MTKKVGKMKMNLMELEQRTMSVGLSKIRWTRKMMH
jgi:hypothetical protein